MQSKLRSPFLPNQFLPFILGKKPSSSSRQSRVIFERETEKFAIRKPMWVSKLRSLRWASVIVGVLNLVVIVLGGFLIISIFPSCGRGEVLPFFVVLVAAGARIISMICSGIAQKATAATILGSPAESSVVDAVIRHDRRMRYKRWLWWTRFAMIITVLQFVGAAYLTFVAWKFVPHDGNSSGCILGNGWKQRLLVFFLILVWFLVVLQCLTGSDVLRWRSFYATHDNAWKAHYREVFDHGIREALCCLGRVKYLSVMEDDEVYSVARLLGDLVAYRATGTGHLELLAGIALLQRPKQSTSLFEELMEAPGERIQEAAVFHQFAEAAYTGPLLDFGRNPILFPCAWLYRQGIFAPWSRNRRPVLEGDNWWRGHAAAFLNYVNLSPEALRKGRVSQARREAAYFIVVLHHIRSVVIAVRGTETPEDLITDGLCRECLLSVEDLDGLINCNHVHQDVKQRVLSSFPHYGHSGIVEAARELFVQLDGQPGDKDNSSGATGLLSSLLGSGCECDGYNVRIVGHSLGGAIGALLGLRLFSRFPNLHVYAYGTLPCVDPVIAEACSDFVTSIVYNDEFSSRLSVRSIMRLRAAAITALSQNSAADSAMICRLARRALYLSNYHGSGAEAKVSTPSFHSGTFTTEGSNSHMYRRRHFKYTIRGGVFLCAHAISCMLKMPNYHRCCLKKDEDCMLTLSITLEPQGVSNKKSSALTAGSGERDQEFSFPEVTDFTDNLDAAILKDSSDESNICDHQSTCINPCFETAADVISSENPVSQYMESVPSSNEVSVRDPKEMFLPGLIILIVPQQRSPLPLWKGWRVHEGEHAYRAYVANRENFKDIIVSPSMFLDHLPWRCHYAMQKVLETRMAQGQLDVSHIV